MLAHLKKRKKKWKREIVKRFCRGQLFTNFFQCAPSSAPQRSHPVPNISFSLNVTFLSEKALSGDEATRIMSKNVTERAASLLKKLQHIPMNINHDMGTTPKTDIFFCPSNSGPIKFFVLLKWPILPRKTSISETGVIELMRGRRLSVVWNILTVDVNHKKFWDQIKLRRHFVPRLIWHIFTLAT